jgi:hypothetical protein
MVLDQKKLLKAIHGDLKACREATRFNLIDEKAKERSDLEFSTLTTHLMWTESVGNNQTELESNPFLSGYQRWRERCEI